MKNNSTNSSTAWWFDYEDNFSGDEESSFSSDPKIPYENGLNGNGKAREPNFNPFRKKTNSAKSILEKLRTPGYDWYSEWNEIIHHKKQTV